MALRSRTLRFPARSTTPSNISSLHRTLTARPSSAEPAPIPASPSSNRPFSTTSHRRTSPLFNLPALAGSRESQYFSKERNIPRTEYSTPLQLIRSSEVDPFAPAPGASPAVLRDLQAAKRSLGQEQGYLGQERGSLGQEQAAGVDKVYEAAIRNLTTQLAAGHREIGALTTALERVNGKWRKAETWGAVWLMVAVWFGVMLVDPDFKTGIEVGVRWLCSPEGGLGAFWENWEERCHWMFAGGIGFSQGSAGVERCAVEGSRAEGRRGEDGGRVDARERVGASILRAEKGRAVEPRSALTRLFWASPD